VTTHASDRASFARERRELAWFVLVALATRALLLYRHGNPEPDATAMVAGMALGMSGSLSAGDALLYGRHVNPGMHALATHLFPALHLAPHHLMTALNWLGAVCAALCVWPLHTLLRPHLSHGVTLACLGVWLFMPLVWESGTYYHPLGPATLLFLLSMVCARHIRASDRGLLWGTLALALAAAAFVLRVEIAIVWPALLVWTLTSRHRGRDTSVLLVLTAGTAAAYLLAERTMSGATSADAPRVGTFLQSIAQRYAHSVNFAGLPRSAAWMVFGMGVATLAGCVMGCARIVRARLARNERRLALASLAWALPSILVWLPQPTPILRHYFLATIGISAFLGVALLARMDRRRLWPVAALIAIANLLVPEAVYRGINAGASAPKTPHGAFLYSHRQAAARIDHNNAVAERILSCTRDPERAGSCALVQWEVFAHIAHAAAVSGARVQPRPVETLFPGVRYVRFGIDGHEARLIHYVYFEDDSLRTIASNIMRESHAGGYCLFAPRALCDTAHESLREITQCY
jgi:hypothetical protein